ncbi:AAA family ATPase [Lactococcus lactis]|uniref:AAA family ATPase n=1 Tax=Lactococcus lactis TaxID=1358 RepID=UPI0028BD9AEF|nr:AAA family ATPase [Lactococcus lactis]WNN68989.1 AAA family ATPase [Lactococcus lactis]WPK08275.1 AAA family ATPase [Lactococcus lactis]
MNNQKKYLSNIQIKHFRLAEDIEFNPASCLNILLGKNGTAKSTVLGMIGQGFSFNPKLVSSENLTMGEYKNLIAKDKLSENERRLKENYENLVTYTNKNFETKVNEHFKLSKSDVTGSVHADMILKSTGNNIADEEFIIESNKYSDRANPRLVTRRMGKDVASEKDTSSSNLIFPVIYLGLNRVMPIVQSGNIHAIDLGLSKKDENRIFDYYESILLKTYENNLEGISNDSIKNTAAFIPKERSLEMISSGEDNIGQILLSLFSFKKLKEKYTNYNGGILLIDEIDVTLYPAAQLKLIDIIYQLALEFKIQVFCTTHSIELIDYAMQLKLDNKKNQFIKLFNFKLKSGKLYAHETLNINEIKNEFLALANKKKINEKIPIYFEDNEASYVFKQLITSQKIKKFLSFNSGFTLGCDELKKLNRLNIAEFSKDAIVCLDGDTSHNANNFISLPTIGKYPPERFVYTILTDKEYFLENSTSSYDESILMNNSNHIGVKSILGGYADEAREPYGTESHGKKDRNVWKSWFKEEQKNWSAKNDPVRFWMKQKTSKKSLQSFYSNLKSTITFVSKNKGIDTSEAIEELDLLISKFSK